MPRGTVSRFACTLPLPTSFRPGDILAFHRRDAQELAERVGETALLKGLVWAGVPACLSIRFPAGAAEAEITFDGAVADDREPIFRAMVQRMLGLTQDIEAFERRYRRHPQLGRLIARQAGLRVPVAATPFEALAWAVTGQQISVGAAVALRRKLIETAGVRHSSGLFCYPEAGRIAALTEAEVRRAGFSGAKSRTLLVLSRKVEEGGLPLAEWLPTVPVDDIRARLLAVPGVGPWTVDYTLLRGFGWLDGSLHGDAAVRRNLQTLLDAPDRIGAEQARDWLRPFSPWRALVAAHLWAMRSPTAY
jgi:DNA-3-methyladenine glycosylase II